MASRAVDLLITYRIIKLLVTPFEKQEAFKQGIIDKDGNVLKPNRTLKTTQEKRAYTSLHRFVFNLKRILKRVGLGGRLGSFAVALAVLLREDNQYNDKKNLIESAVVTYLKESNQYEELLNECREINEETIDGDPYITAFGFDVYETEKGLITENTYA